MKPNDPQLFQHLTDFTHRSPLILVQVELHSIEYIESLYEKGEVTGLGCMVPVYKVDGHNYRIGHIKEVVNRDSALCIYEKVGNDIRLVILDLKLQVPLFCVKEINRLRFDDFDYHEGYSQYCEFLKIDSNDEAALECGMTVDKSSYPWINV